MTIVARRFAFLAAALLASCATPSIVPGRDVEVREQPVPAMGAHENCVRMQPGDRLEYRFSSNRPIKFNVHYHEGKVVIAPLTRDDVTSDAGVFDPLGTHEYCLMWEAGPIDTLIEYRVRMLPGGARR